MSSIPRIAIVAFAVSLLSVSAVAANTTADEPTASANTIETNEVKRAEHKAPKHPSLRFLRDNRVFIRAQLDRLRLQTTRVRNDDARSLDARYLRLKEMSEAIAAARDTIRARQALASETELLESVTELAALEAQLAEMERLLADQRRRLLLLEEDFLGHQQTALVVVIKGLGSKGTPETVVFAEDNEVVRVTLSEQQRASLAHGGIVQIYHEFVEPREHVYQVSFAGVSWDESVALSVPLEAARNRLTFLELDLSRLDSGAPSGGLETAVWYR